MEEMEKTEAQRELTRSVMGSPFRFYCPAGESREIVVVDDAPNFFRHEHNLQNQRSKKWDIFVACINDHANCPVCKETDRSSYFAMYLTIIDLEPYENRNGETVEWSKKLMVVKQTQQKKIMRLYERHGTLRGMVLQMTRDGDKDAAIGNDIEFIEFMSEEDLESYVTSYEDQNGKEHEVIGAEPFDYDAIFPEPTEQQLRAIVGGKAEAGSREDDDRELGRGRSRRGDDDDGFRSRSARGGREERQERSRPARRGREEADDDAQETETDDDARESRRSARTAPARRSARDEQDDDPPPRRATRGRAAEPADEEDDPPQRQRAAATRSRPAEDEPPARRPATSMAERRRALRR